MCMVMRALFRLVVLAFLVIGISIPISAPAAGKQSPAKQLAAAPVTLQIDKTEYNPEDTVKITGMSALGKPVFIEIASGRTVEVRRLDSKKDKETGKIPWIFYTSDDI